MFWPVRLGSILLAIGGCLALDIACRSALGTNEQRLVLLAGLYVTLAVSLNLINGITGQFSIGHAAFYQVGAYTAGFLTITFYKASSVQGVPWLLVMAIVGCVAAGIAGLVVGLPSLRLKGDYLAIVTLGFGEIIRIVVNNQPTLGGSYGLNVQPRMVAPQFWMIALAWLLAVLCIAVCRNLLKTAHGLPFLAVREDEVASLAMGVNVTRVKVVAFVVGSMFAGAAGALLAHYEGFITPPTFGMDVSFIILTMVVLGGKGSITGSAIAAVFLFYLPEWLRNLKQPGSNNPITISAATFVAAIFAIALVVMLIKRLMDRGWGTPAKRTLANVGLIVVGIAFCWILGLLLGNIPALETKKIEAGQLRMVIFAVTLIVLMLLRPQGVFAHHEFSWNWVQKLFGKRNLPQKEAFS
jgi:branched-chain amino acid transport system permease protein